MTALKKSQLPQPPVTADYVMSIDTNRGLPSPLLVTVKMACHLLSCGPTLLYAMIADRRLERVRLGGRTTITVASIERLIELEKQQ